MIHAREDYNRIQDPSGKIAEDEPVFMVRAKDQCFAETVRFWALLHKAKGGDPVMSDMANAHANLAESWQAVNGCKIANL